MNRLLALDKLPALLAIALGLAGWGLAHTIDQLLAAPLIEYKQEQGTGNDQSVTVTTLTNITRATAFRNLQVAILIPDNIAEATIDSARMRYVPPGWKDRSEGAIHPIGRAVTFPVRELQPGWSVELTVAVSPPVRPQVRFNTDSSAAVALVHRNFATWLLRHQGWALLGFLTFALGVIVWYVHALLRASPSAKARA
jgi:hypothetical protein